MFPVSAMVKKRQMLADTLCKAPSSAWLGQHNLPCILHREAQLSCLSERMVRVLCRMPGNVNLRLP